MWKAVWNRLALKYDKTRRGLIIATKILCAFFLIESIAIDSLK